MGYGRYGTRSGQDSEIVTSILTHDWLDLDCPLTSGHDGLTLAGAAPAAMSRSTAKQPPRRRSGSPRR